MNVLFAHDHYFIPLEGGVYSESQFPASTWGRYLEHFDSVVVFARKRQSVERVDTSHLARSSASNVFFAFGPNLSSPLRQLLCRREARRRLRVCFSQVDAVIARLPSELGLIAIAEARRAGLPWAVEVVGCAWDGLWNHGSWQAKLYAPIMMARMQRATAKAPFVLYVTRHFLQRRYPNTKGQAVACSNVAIDRPRLDVLERRIARIAGRTRPITLGLIGTLKTRYKGIQTVLAALSRLPDRLRANVRFRVLGAGNAAPWREEAKSCGVEDLVSFDGVLPAGDPVLEWLDNVDIYLQPSLQEGLPRALIEAMSRGCPAIGSNRAGIPELLPEECLIRAGDADGLARRLGSVIEDVEWQIKQAKRNWDEAARYSRERLDAERSEFWGRFAKHAAASASPRKKQLTILQRRCS